jgi:hypothetical protein
LIAARLPGCTGRHLPLTHAVGRIHYSDQAPGDRSYAVNMPISWISSLDGFGGGLDAMLAAALLGLGVHARAGNSRVGPLRV